MTPPTLSIAQRDELAHVEHCALAASFALAQRDDAIRMARAAGLSLRAVAEAAGMTAMGVKGICDRD